jgi:hypothetical protein
MSTLALAVLIILVITTATLSVAGSVYGHGAPWAMDLCYNAGALCQHPEWTAYASVAVAIAYVILRRGEV